MLKDTLFKFGYPSSLIKEYQHWYLLCRPQQVTFAAMILIAKSDVHSLADLSTEYFAEFESIVKEISIKLQPILKYEKINYLMLMMVDPEVHFHILPRYSETKSFEEITFIDAGWPKLANLEHAPNINKNTHQKLTQYLAKLLD